MKFTVREISFTCLILLMFTSYSNAQQAQVRVDQDKDIAKLLEFKKDLSTVDLYKIQVFQGNRSSAEDAKSKFANLYGEWPISMEYETPNYKIWVGNFRSRLEADKALIKIKKNYMNAFIFKPKKEKKTP
ncbi:sporulation related protein [Flavobacteriaceae bacterium MAR_2010_72]|nr:sporulation related protein [Flavobacteriaceae bacterium MAR_2010_72]TVZ58571.1 sporulation related protein [Flavobacteriaceae bacterium MAR_2010_105]